ncbi:ATP-binding protein (plasmid) [Alicyclobacillus fastidiosus]|uniref:histidine kinase n=2 Tax=Alicyclobacillus fastidiosus TaxID=392011 RepID=A0ABY6ZQ35_9BACL|nr:ATP-binding protein [Alicyclobacillus fastidiosus]
MRSHIIRMLNPRSLKYQLLSRSIIIMTVLLVLIGVFQYAFMDDFLYRNEAVSIETRIESIPKSAWEDLSDHHIIPDRDTLFKLETPGATIAFINVHGSFTDLFVDTDDDKADSSHENDLDQGPSPRLSQQTYQNAVNNSSDMTYTLTNDNLGNTVLVVLHRVGEQSHALGVVQVTVPIAPLQHILIKQLTVFAFLVMCALCAGVFTFLPILRRTLIPLSRVVETVGRVNAGNLDERFMTTHAQLEIALLASSFNAMLERLKKSFEAERIAKERMRQFVADASHELRTPLTTINGFLEVLLRGAAANPAKLDKALRSMYGESQRVNKLVQDLLFLAKIDREPTFVFEDSRLDLLLTDMKPQLLLLAGERAVEFVVSEAMVVNCDPDRIKQVVLNLFQNAVQHTDANTGEINVSLVKDFAGARIQVKDNGTGIPSEHQSQLFERFYRVDSARSRKNGGVGLGLSITKSIVDNHGGTISFESQVGKGTIFNVWLPVK